MPNTTDPAVRKMIAQRKAVWAVVPDGRTELLIEPRKRTIFVSGGKPIGRRKTPNPSTACDYRAEFAEHAKSVEQFVGHMYLDKKGNVTVGYGHLLADLGMLEDINSRFELSDMAIATGVDLDRAIIEDFERLKAQAPGNRSARAYEAETTARMDPAAGWPLLQDDIDIAIRIAKDMFLAFDTFPNGAKLGVLEMVFNLGPGGLEGTDEDPKFPNFRRAVRDRDWRTAACEAHRLIVSESRNRKVFEWFNMYAVREEPYSVQP